MRKILKECFCKLNTADLSQKENPTEEESLLISRLIACVNTAVREAACEYLPQIYEQCVESENGVIDVRELDKRILYPISLVLGDKKIKIKTYPSCLKADFRGAALLRYVYIPDEYGIDDDVEIDRMTADVASDGALAEYYFRNRVFDIAQYFDARFRNALTMLRYKGREIKLPSGRW